VPFESSFRTVEDLKKASSSQPLITAGPGLGTIPYIAAMLMKKYAGVDITYVPFNSGSESALAVAGGKTQIGMGNFDSYHALHEQKKVRVIALVAPQRDPAYPDIPTVAEQGYPRVVLAEMTGVFAPPGLPKERLDILMKGFEKAVADPDLKAAAAKAQVSLLPLASEEFFKASKRMHESVKEMEDLLKVGEPK